MLTESPLLPWELIDSPRANGSYLIQRADCKSSGPAAAFQFAHSSPGRVLKSVKCSLFVLIVYVCVCVCECVCVYVLLYVCVCVYVSHTEYRLPAADKTLAKAFLLRTRMK